MSRLPHRRLAPLLGAALVAGAVAGAAPAFGSLSIPEGGARVAIVFLPGPPPKAKPPMISRLAARRNLAIGFSSSILGSYTSTQALLDISAGARTWTSLYDGDPPDGVRLERGGVGGAIAEWGAIRRRAETPPADIVPGSLGQTVRRAGGQVAYVGLERRLNREAIVAADEAGRVQGVVITSPARVGREAVREWRGVHLLVARLPGGSEGWGALDELLASRRPQDLLLVVQDPTRVARRLLAVGAAGLGDGRNMRSDSTRTDGLVVSTDIEPTVLGHLGLRTPEGVTGRPIEAHGGRSAGELTEMKDRFSEIGPRRWAIVLAALLAGWIVVAGVAAATGEGRTRRAGRGTFLVALWLPATLLVTGALAPSRLGEVVLAGAPAGLLALATDRLLPWPRALALPAGVAVGSHLLDLAFGSEWTQRSLLGPNPLLGARFYGIGNELEVVLGVIALLGLGALLATAEQRTLVWGFLVGGGVLALLLSWGKLGADVGASVMLAAGTAAAVVAGLGERPGRGRLALVLAAPALALAALAALDLATGGDAHFTRSVLRAGGLKDLGDIAQRRLELSYHSLGKGLVALFVAIAVAVLAWGIRARHRLLEPVAWAPGIRAGLYGALVAVIAGALANDSGPIILLIGASYLALCTVYFRAAPG